MIDEPAPEEYAGPLASTLKPLCKGVTCLKKQERDKQYRIEQDYSREWARKLQPQMIPILQKMGYSDFLDTSQGETSWSDLAARSPDGKLTPIEVKAADLMVHDVNPDKRAPRKRGTWKITKKNAVRLKDEGGFYLFTIDVGVGEKRRPIAVFKEDAGVIWNLINTKYTSSVDVPLPIFEAENMEVVYPPWPPKV